MTGWTSTTSGGGASWTTGASGGASGGGVGATATVGGGASSRTTHPLIPPMASAAKTDGVKRFFSFRFMEGSLLFKCLKAANG
jgi:hypothetical protein